MSYRSSERISVRAETSHRQDSQSQWRPWPAILRSLMYLTAPLNAVMSSGNGASDVSALRAMFSHLQPGPNLQFLQSGRNSL